MISTGNRASSARAGRLVVLCAAFAAIVLGARGGRAAESAYTRAEADSLQRKIDQIARLGLLTPAAGRKTTVTTVSDREVNAYLRFHIRDQVPQGIADPVITIIGDRRVSGRATVDLDAVSRANRSGSWFDPLRLLSGQLPVTLAGTLETSDGTGRFLVESATISGVPVPKTVLQQVVSHYSATPEDPDGIGLDDAFALPAQIREIRVQQPGQALVVQ
jgi:hypothetical protein